MKVGKNHVTAIGFLAIVSFALFVIGSSIAFAQSSDTSGSGITCCCCLAFIIAPIAAILAFVYMKLDKKNKVLQNIKTLSESKDPRGIDQLVRLLNDPDLTTRNNAARALQDYEVAFIGPILTSIMTYQRNNIRASTTTKRPIDINVVTRQGPGNLPIRTVTVDLAPSTISSLIPLMNSDNNIMRDMARRVLIEFESVAVEPLIDALHSPDKNTRVNALYVLGEIRDIRASEPVMNALKDEDVDVRNAAATALKGFNITTAPKEKETIKEIVKVPCGYCGTLIDVTSTKCSTCGAPLKH